MRQLVSPDPLLPPPWQKRRWPSTQCICRLASAKHGNVDIGLNNFFSEVRGAFPFSFCCSLGFFLGPLLPST